MDKADVQLVMFDQVDLTGGVHLLQDQVDLWIGLLELAEDLGQAPEQHRGHETHAQRAGCALGGLRGDGFGLLQLMQQPRGVLGKDGPRLGQSDRSVRSNHQSKTKGFLQLAQAGA